MKGKTFRDSSVNPLVTLFSVHFCEDFHTVRNSLFSCICIHYVSVYMCIRISPHNLTLFWSGILWASPCRVLLHCSLCTQGPLWSEQLRVWLHPRRQNVETGSISRSELALCSTSLSDLSLHANIARARAQDLSKNISLKMVARTSYGTAWRSDL